MRVSVLLIASLSVLAACGSGDGELPSPTAAGSGSESVGPPLPASLKGYELYAWDDGDVLRFTLITGTNRPKTAVELSLADNTVEDGEWVILNRAGLPQLEQLLQRVPSGTPIVFSQHPDLPVLSGPNRERIERALADAGF
jgi:hypothetical protein